MKLTRLPVIGRKDFFDEDKPSNLAELQAIGTAVSVMPNAATDMVCPLPAGSQTGDTAVVWMVGENGTNTRPTDSDYTILSDGNLSSWNGSTHTRILFTTPVDSANDFISFPNAYGGGTLSVGVFRNGKVTEIQENPATNNNNAQEFTFEDVQDGEFLFAFWGHDNGSEVFISLSGEDNGDPPFGNLDSASRSLNLSGIDSDGVNGRAAYAIHTLPNLTGQQIIDPGRASTDSAGGTVNPANGRQTAVIRVSPEGIRRSRAVWKF